MDLSKQIPIINQDDPDFKEKLNFELWSTQSSTDYRNDRERPYNGQDWTDDGERGKTEVKGLTFRDIKDCLVKAILSCSASDKYFDEFSKCWDFSECKNEHDTPKPTEYLLSKQSDPDYICTKVNTGNWRYHDIYLVNWSNISPGALCKNLCTEIEKMMGIYPNIKKDDIDFDPIFNKKK